MKKGTLTLVLALALVGLTGQAWAQETEDSIAVTVELASELSVTVTPSTWVIGSVALDHSEAASFDADVGNTATKLEIAGTNGAGPTGPPTNDGWTIGSAGPDSFDVAVTSPAISLTTAYHLTPLDASVAAYGTKNFELNYTAPSSDTFGAGVDQSFSVTVKASAP